MTLRVFIGYEPRQPVAYNVLQYSIVRNSSVPVAITPLILSQLPITRQGLTQFTFSRFLVPYLCGYQGRAVFMDADMLVTGDIAKLFDAIDPGCAVSVVKEQPEFEWASVMAFSCGACLKLTPEYVQTASNEDLFHFAWANQVGELPPEWNHFVGYQEPAEASLYHYSQGIPAWWETRNNPEDAHWLKERDAMNRTVPWKELMGRSVHADAVKRRIMERLS